MKDKIKNKFRDNEIMFSFLKINYKFFYEFLTVKFFSILFLLVPINRKRIAVCNYYGKGYGDNARAIIDELFKISSEKYQIIWALDSLSWSNNNLPCNIIKVRYKSIKHLFYLSTAKVWIDNSRKEFLPFKRKNQFYIQTWHGSYPLKKIERDAAESLPNFYIRRAKKDSKCANLFLSGSKWTTKLYRDSFYYDGEIYECGIPRNDVFFKRELHANIRRLIATKYNTKNKMIVLYAPTFRKNYTTNPYNINFNIIHQAVKQRYKRECVILVRLHPNISNKFNQFFGTQKHVIDASNYPDMQELMIASDVLITDYSSTMFEFGLLSKPVYLYVNDYNSYTDDRGFYFNISELPFVVCYNNKQLFNNITLFNFDEYQRKLQMFFAKIGLFEDGNASKAVAKRIIEKCDLNEKA